MDTQQRDAIKQISPVWLANDSPATSNGIGIGGRYMYVLGLGLDCLLEKLNQAARAHMPTLAPASALPYIGLDRVMPQGPGETNAAYAMRLQGAFDAWARAGGAPSLLAQVAAYLTGQTGPITNSLPLCALVGGYKAEKWSWLVNGNALPSVYNAPTQNWIWDGTEASYPWREWLIIYVSSSPLGIAGSTANITTSIGNFTTITGLTKVPSTITSTSQPGYITLSGAASSGNNGSFQITQWLSSTSIVAAMPKGVASDANNGAITWSISNFTGLQPLPVFGFSGATWGNNTNKAMGVQVQGAPNSFNTSSYVTGLRSLVARWKNSSSWVMNVILRFSVGADLSPGTEFSPWSSAGSGNPNGGWGQPGKTVANVVVPSRLTGAQFGTFDAYCTGTASVNGAPVNYGGV
jgi:hypothetical protein